MKSSKMWIRICNILCSILIVTLLVFQFQPFWTMPTCECDLRCELKTDKHCPACSIYEEWCVVPTSCICEIRCTAGNVNEDCPVCTQKYRKCVAASRIAEPAETTEAVVDEATEPTVEATEPAETTEVVEDEATEPVVENAEPAENAEEKELVLTPIAPAPAMEDRVPVKVSIQEYTWLCGLEKYEDGVTEYFKDYFDDTFDKDYRTNDMAMMPGLVMFLGILAIALGLLKSAKILGSVFGLAVGIIATLGYLTNPIFQMGIGWQTHMYIAIAIIVVAATTLGIAAAGNLRKALAKK